MMGQGKTGDCEGLKEVGGGYVGLEGFHGGSEGLTVVKGV